MSDDGWQVVHGRMGETEVERLTRERDEARVLAERRKVQVDALTHERNRAAEQLTAARDLLLRWHVARCNVDVLDADTCNTLWPEAGNDPIATLVEHDGGAYTGSCDE